MSIISKLVISFSFQEFIEKTFKIMKEMIIPNLKVVIKHYELFPVNMGLECREKMVLGSHPTRES